MKTHGKECMNVICVIRAFDVYCEYLKRKNKIYAMSLSLMWQRFYSDVLCFRKFIIEYIETQEKPKS